MVVFYGEAIAAKRIQNGMFISGEVFAGAKFRGAKKAKIYIL
jgi:hypothetical protein